MLKKIFESGLLQYYKYGEHYIGGFGVADFLANPPTYIETIVGIKAVFTHPVPTKTSPISIYVFSMNAVSWWPSWGPGFYRFDGQTGEFLGHVSSEGNLGTTLLQRVVKSRRGRLYFLDYYGRTFYQFTLGDSVVTGDYTENPDSLEWTSGQPIYDSHFGLLGLGFFGDCAIDDKDDLFLNFTNNTVSVYKLSTGVFVYSERLPASIVRVCLEEDQRVYILLSNDILMLFDYKQKIVLGTVKVPLDVENVGGASSDMFYDPLYRRLLFVPHTPDDDGGASTVYIRGYRMVPIPTRITTPIPLKVPKKGRVIPVMTKVTGDLNESVGGYNVQATIVGSGTVVGVPTTTSDGSAIVKVSCNTDLAGSPGLNDVTLEVKVVLDQSPTL